MEATFCPNCQHDASFDRSTGELLCQLCGLLLPPDYQVVRKPFAVCTVWHFVGTIMNSNKRPWHAPYLEMHLMGIERGMYRKDFLSTRHNKAVSIEFMYKRKGLITYFSMN